VGASEAVTPEAIAALLRPYIGEALPDGVCGQLAIYLELILKWNARMNLTAIREPEEIVRRHFGESLFAGIHLGMCGTLLDYGSGAGFPGIPMQLLRPDVRVTLAESQGKKAAFLREAVRELGLDTEVWGGRVADMGPERQFDVVALRAVDGMVEAVREASVRAEGRVMILSTEAGLDAVGALEGFERAGRIALPESTNGVLEILRRV
jgi:16S rRNA (guanine527-N7)-methyltransferase